MVIDDALDFIESIREVIDGSNLGKNRFLKKGTASWPIQLIFIQSKIEGGGGCCLIGGNRLHSIISPKDASCAIAAAGWTAETCKA